MLIFFIHSMTFLPSFSCSCIVPLYNESQRVCNVLNVLIHIPQLEHIFLVNDGSTDDSKTIIESYLTAHPHLPITLLSHDHNQGKTQAVFTALQHVKTSYVFLCDADLTNLQVKEITDLIESMKQQPEIEMGILRRTQTKRHVKMLYKALILSGQRILKTQDLQNIFAQQNFNNYQLEIAINMYMEHHHKRVIWSPFSAKNTFKYDKWGFRNGRKKDLRMFGNIFAYQGFFGYIKHSLTFKPISINTYNTQHHGKVSKDLS